MSGGSIRSCIPSDGRIPLGDHSVDHFIGKKALPKGPTRSTKMDDILAAGRKYMKTSRFRLLAVGAVATGLVGEMLQKHVDALEVAGKSGHYRRAMQALQQGDIAKAHALLTGNRDSL